jgi:putative spermidine/putrescine transport system permease protein
MTTNVTSPVLYALGTMTTVFSFIIIGGFALLAFGIRRRRAGRGSDAGDGMV